MDNRKTMLIIDDTAINRAVYRNVFKDDYHIIEATDGVEGLKLMREYKNELSIVILDIFMPELDGFGVLTEKMNDIEISSIPVIVISSRNDVEIELKSLNLGANDMLVSPYNAQIMKQRVTNIITKHEYEKLQLENLHFREQKENHELLELLLKNVSCGISIYTVSEQQITDMYYNDRYCEIQGYSFEQYSESFKHKTFANIYPDDLDKYEEFTKSILTGEKSFSGSFRLYKQNFEIVWIHTTANRYQTTNNFSSYVITVVDITEEARSKEKIRYRADYDELTGIYNRNCFLRKTEALLASNPDKKYLIGSLNVEKFRILNDLFGTKTSDRILVDIATILCRYINVSGTYGRITADKFVFCLPDKNFNAESIINEIASSIIMHKLDFKAIVDMGIYEVTKDDKITVIQMCDRANLACQTVYGNYDRCVAYYDKTLRNKLIEEQSIVNEMQSALDDKQFVVYFQPIYDIEKMQPASAEALIRWIHPDKGVIPPNRFIPVFEKNGFISKLDHYVWESVCKYIHEAIANGKKVVPISVNASRMSLYNEHVAEDIYELTLKYKINPKLLKIEITESAYNDNPSQLLKTVKTLQSYGFLILMDDFGSGYSSLNTLKDIPVDVLKIDMKFIDDFEKSERAGQIFTSIIDMASNLQIPVIAEGVETEAQLTFLKNIGCRKIQGFYFSKPLPADKYEKHINDKITE